MARQAATTRKAVAPKVTPGPRASKAAAKFDTLSADQKVAHLLAERDALMARVARLEADLSRQRKTQAQVADRVAWALDSLRDILGERP
jgi:chorismate mutase